MHLCAEELLDMSGAVEENAVVALEALYSGPMQGRELAQAREIFAYLRSNNQVSHPRTRVCVLYVRKRVVHSHALQAAAAAATTTALRLPCRVRWRLLPTCATLHGLPLMSELSAEYLAV